MAPELSKSQKIKRLLRKNQKNLEETKCEDQKLQLNKKIDNLLKELEETQTNVQKEKPKIRISDHAIVRYFERILGYDIEKIKKEILPEQLSSQIATLRDGIFPNGDFRLRVREYTVVTVTD